MATAYENILIRNAVQRCPSEYVLLFDPYLSYKSGMQKRAFSLLITRAPQTQLSIEFYFCSIAAIWLPL